MGMKIPTPSAEMFTRIDTCNVHLFQLVELLVDAAF